MKFVCDKCKTKYSIADDKVRRKVLKIRCKNCSNIIVVREPNLAVGLDDEPLPLDHDPRAGSGVRPLARALDGAFRPRRRSSSALRPVPVARAALQDLPALDDEFEPEQTRLSDLPDFPDEPPPPLEDEWFLAVEGNQYGPMAFGELCSRVKRGEASGEAHVWRDGFDDWMDVNEVPELRPYLPRHPPPPPRGKSGLYSVAAMVSGTPHQGLPAVQPPVAAPPVATPPVVSPIAGFGPPMQPAPAPLSQQPSGPGSGVAPIPVPPVAPQSPGSGLFPQVRVAEPSGPAPLPIATPEPPPPDLTPLPLPGRPQEAAVGVPVQVPPAGRTPLWMVIAGIGGGLAAICGLFMVGYLLFFDRPDKETTKVAADPQQQPVQPAAPPAVVPDMGSEPIAFPPMEIARSEQAERKVPSGRHARPKPAPPAAGKQLSESQRRLMALYGDKENPSGEAPKSSAPRRAQRGPTRRISANELMSLQRQHRASLKACYERALKRDQSLTEIKAEVEVSIGDSGVVRTVNISAGNNPDLVNCIRRSIRRWAFPSIGAQTFSFPIIFRGS